MNNLLLKNVQLEWCKLLGKPRENYNKDGFEWSCNFIISEDQRKELLANNVSPKYIKSNDAGNLFFAYKRNAHKADGSKKSHTDIRNRYGENWNHSDLIGNGSTADIVVLFTEMGVGPNKGKMKPAIAKVVVRELNKYEADDGVEYDSREEVEAGLDNDTATIDNSSDW